MNHEGDGDTNYNLSTWINPQRIGTDTGWQWNKKTSRDHPNYVKIGQNLEKRRQELRLPVT